MTTIRCGDTPTTRRLADEDEIRLAPHGQIKVDDLEESISPTDPWLMPPGEEGEGRPPARGEAYGSELFTRNSMDPYIQYANFTPVSLDAPQRLVNSKKISLQYQVRNAGPSGVALVEVWRTCDGHKWEKYAEQRNARPPFMAEVEKEGLYGFTLIPRAAWVWLARLPRMANRRSCGWKSISLRHTSK